MRHVIGFVAGLFTLMLLGPSVAAQDATPTSGSPLDELGLPELRVVATDEGIELPAEAEAGRYLVVLENRSPFDVEATFILPPVGLTLADLLATPEAEDGLPPAWYYEATIAGGVSDPGGTDRAVVDLAPGGEWVVETYRGNNATDEEYSDLLPLTVSGDAEPGGGPGLEADATIEMVDLDFIVPANLQSGPRVWEVTNTGAQPHHLFLSRVPAPITDEQMMEVLEIQFGMRGEDATPSPDQPAWVMDEAAFEDAAYVPVLSSGRAQWVALDLAPGTYVALCFVPDRVDGMPHALMGMVEVFIVGG